MMDFADSPEEAAFRAYVREWIAEKSPRHLFDELKNAPYFTLALKSEDPIEAARAWQRSKAQDGWAACHWPSEYGGRDASPIQRVIWAQEEGVYARLSLPFSIGIGMAGPTVMNFASDDLKSRLLPRILSGEDLWCQLFSEPGAGSDLAAMSTRAVRRSASGSEWVLNGQKVWSSFAQYAKFGLLLARTDPERPKHKGLTMFFVDMESPGVEVRPIRQMNEGSTFNEVYLTDVVVPDSNRLGGVDEGWQVSISTLMHERMSASSTPTGFDELFDLARRLRGPAGRAIDDPVIRSKMARWATISLGLRHTYFRNVCSLAKGSTPGPEASIGKLTAASTMQDITRFALQLLEREGMTMEPSPHNPGAWFQEMFLRAPALRIEAGSDEILKNVIGERVLGLPGEPRHDKDRPFVDAKRSD